MTPVIQVVTTIDSQEGANHIARLLVERNLAACVQVIGPIQSTYRWQGSIETTEEWCCVVKTRQDRYHAVEAAIREVHPYDVPEILAVPVVAGNPAYLTWVQETSETGVQAHE